MKINIGCKNHLTDTDQRKEKIQAEQIKLLFQQILPSIVSAYITVIVFTLYFKKKEESNIVLFSLSTLIILSLTISVLLYYAIKKNKKNIKKLMILVHSYTLNLFFTALLWSLFFSWIYNPDEIKNAYFIIFTCIGYLVSAAPVLSSFFLCYAVFSLTFSTPIIITLIMSSYPQHQILALFMFCLLIVMLFFSHWYNRMCRNTISLQFENLDLVRSLQIQKNAAEQANQAKSRFLAAASHDLRQPLHALSLFTAVLNESVKQPKTRLVVEQINMSVKALESLFNALLDISQLDAGVLTPEKTHVDLYPLLMKLANDYEPQANEKGIDLLFSHCSYLLFTDESLLEQILRNYISNAIRYTDTGVIKVHFEVENETSIRINVTDTGVGISGHEQQAIFDEFYQLDNQERDRSKGLGLGLAIVQRTANLLGHTINVQSTLGEGSTFSIIIERSIKYTTLTTPALTVHKNKNRNRNNKKNTIKPVILVIDNEVSVREGTQNLLEMWDCNVFSAANQEEALTILRQQDQIPDGIIADYRLAKQKTGVEAILAVHAEYNNDIAALIVTGDIDSERLVDISKSGFQVLYKPVATLKLRTFIDSIQVQKKKRTLSFAL